MLEVLIYSAVLLLIAGATIYYFYRVDKQKKKSSEKLDGSTPAADVLLEGDDESLFDFPEPSLRSEIAETTILGLNHRGLRLYRNAGGSGDPATITLFNTTPSEIDSFSAPSGALTAKTVADSHHTVKDQFGNVLADVDIPATEGLETTVTIEQTCSKLINAAVTTGAGTPEANGTWIWNEDTGRYENKNGYIMDVGGNGWVMIVDGVGLYRAGTSTSGNPWQGDEWFDTEGKAPAPTFQQATEPCTVTFRVGDELNGYATWEDIPADTELTIPAVDQDGNAVVVSKNEDGELVVPDLPCAAPPTMTVGFEADDTTPNVGDEVQFTDQTTGTPTDWCWDVNENQFGTEQNPTLTPLFAGDLDIRLIAGGSASSGGVQTKAAYLAVGGLLDKLAAPIAFAPFLLKYGYGGACMTVRPQGGSVGDNVSVGLNSNGQLDEVELLTAGDDVFIYEYNLQDGTGGKFDGAASTLIVEGGVIHRIWNRPAPRFNGIGSRLVLPYFDFWGGSDRTKLYFCFVLEAGDSLSSSQYSFAQMEPDNLGFGFLRDGSNNRMRVRWYGTGLSGSDQIMSFSSLGVNEACVIDGYIDTSQADPDDRCVMRKNGTPMSLADRSGDVGVIFNSTADFTLGCFNADSPVGFFDGKIGSVFISPTADQPEIGECMKAIFQAP